MTPPTWNRAALAGVLGPAVFITAFTIQGWLRPGYSSRNNVISELSLGPWGWVQILNFVFSGALIIAFAWGVARAFPTGRASRAGPVMLALIGTGLAVSGPFVMEPVGTVPSEMHIGGLLHLIFGAMVFSLCTASCFVFFRRFRVDAAWRKLSAPTLMLGITMTVVQLFWKVLPARPPAPPNVFNEWVGLFQRVTLIPYFLWVMIFAATLWQRPETR